MLVSSASNEAIQFVINLGAGQIIPYSPCANNFPRPCLPQPAFSLWEPTRSPREKLQAERGRAGSGCVRRGRISPRRAAQGGRPRPSQLSGCSPRARAAAHSGHAGSCPARGKHHLCAVRAARLLRAPARCHWCRAAGPPGPGSRGCKGRRYRTHVLRSLVSDAKTRTWCPATFSIVAEGLEEKKKIGFACFL